MDNLELAIQNNSSEKTTFMLDDAQKLEQIGDNSVDLLICIESAFHYPDKHAFFSQIKRVLRPDGKLRIWYDKNAKDTAAAKARYQSQFYRTNQKLTGVGYNLFILGGI